ncbi:MAG: hypothetical protein ABI947_05420 [Chloroflexota bacterium]
MTEKKPTSLQQAVPQLPLRPQTQTAAIIALLLVMAIIIGSLYLAQATTTATIGQQRFQLSATRDYLQRANEDIAADIALRRNISTLRGRAQALGFVPVGSDRLDYLVINGYSPVRATATPEVTAEPKYVYDETFNGFAQQQWNTLVKQFEAWAGRPTPAP